MKIHSLFIALAIFSAVSSPAMAISKSYQAKLDKSGCTEITANDGTCDIHKTKAQNGLSSHETAVSAPKTTVNTVLASAVASLAHDFQQAGHTQREAQVMAEKFANSASQGAVYEKDRSCSAIADEMQANVNQAQVDVQGALADSMSIHAGKVAKLACYDVRN